MLVWPRWVVFSRAYTRTIAALSILVIPFFTAALIADGAFHSMGASLIDLFGSDSLIVKLFIWTLRFLILAAITYTAMVIIDPIIVRLSKLLPETDEISIMAWIGFACIAAGLFALGFVVDGLPKSPLNPFWHFGLLSYGLSLVNRSGRF